VKETTSLNDVEPETTIIVERIEGNPEIKMNLDMVGLFEGVKLTVVTTKIGEELVTIGRGLAGKILIS
jgi:FeoA domain.